MKYTECKKCGIRVYGPGRCGAHDEPAPKTVIEILDTMIAKEAIRLQELREKAVKLYDFDHDRPDFCPMVREQHGRLNALADLRVELLGRGLV
jgi:hypothetical protein